MANHSLRCMKCYKKYERNYLLSNMSSEWILWRNVIPTGGTEYSVICTCRSCGHVYRSNSRCARNAFRLAKERGEL